MPSTIHVPSSASNIAVEQILNTDPEKLTKTFLENMFAGYHDKETNVFKDSNFKPTDRIKLTHEQYSYVKDFVETTLGLLVFNRYVLERTGVIQYLGYWNHPLNKKSLESLNTQINNLVITDKITTKDLGNYIDSRDRMGFWCATFLSVSITPTLVRPMENVNKRKKELFDQYHDKLNSDNPVEQIMTVNAIEKELMGMVRENLKGDSGYDLYASGDGNLDNNYKTINVMRGAVFNNSKHKYDIVENSLMNGIDKKDIPSFSNSILAAAYPSAIGTADAGYMSKIIMALLQSERLDPDPESDCGTTSTIPLTITNKNKAYVLFRYIHQNGKKVLTTLDNIDSFIGKTVQLYSPQCCKNSLICGKCAGRVFHNLGVTNAGLLSTQITQKLLNVKLKSKHDLSQNAGIIPIESTFLQKNDYAYIENGILKNKVTMRIFIPRFFDEFKAFIRESTIVESIGVIPVKFYDKNDKVLLSTMLTVPSLLTFNLYSTIQEDINNYIITYEPESEIAVMEIQKNAANVEFFINQIYLWSKIPQIPYKFMTEMMFRSLEINSIDLTGPSIIYEMLARRVCRHGNDSFAKAYGNDPNIDQMSYQKLGFREAVQKSGILQAILFQDISSGINRGLSMTLNGIESEETPLEQIIKC